jgi:hypothetical protein
MTLSDHKGKQIISDTIQKPFLQAFLTMFITAPLADIHHLQDPQTCHSQLRQETLTSIASHRLAALLPEAALV